MRDERVEETEAAGEGSRRGPSLEAMREGASLEPARERLLTSVCSSAEAAGAGFDAFTAVTANGRRPPFAAAGEAAALVTRGIQRSSLNGPAAALLKEFPSLAAGVNEVKELERP